MTHFQHAETDRFIATFGTVPGYSSAKEGMPLSVFEREWGFVVMRHPVSDSVPAIAATITHSSVVYPYEGQMRSERIYTVMGVRNPYYIPDKHASRWGIAVLSVVDEMRVRLKQTTAQVVFDLVQAHYFVED